METLERIVRLPRRPEGAAPRAPRAARRREAWPIWLGTAITAAIAVAAALWYWRVTEGFSPRAATPIGRWYGGVGVGLMALLTLYIARRRCFRRRLGSLELWYRAHLWLGVLALALVGVHCGFHTRGLFLTLLQIAFWGSVASGLLGWVIQTWLKGALLRFEPRPLVMAGLRAELATERAALPARLPTTEPYDLELTLRALAALRRRHLWRFPSGPTWEAMATALSGRALSRHLNCLDPSDTAAVLESLARLNRLEVIASYHRWLRAWTTLHLALALAVAQLVAWHIYLTTAY
jgi:hypothetical protein